MVQTVIQANSLTMQMVQDFADLKAHVTENMVTKSDIRDMATKYQLDAAITALRADMYHAVWIQGGVLGALILGLAGLILVQA